jgi:WhiB family redox-sensing transcriptional regulator
MSFGMPEVNERTGPRLQLVADPDQGRGGHAMSVTMPVHDTEIVQPELVHAELMHSELSQAGPSEGAPGVLATADVVAAMVDPVEAELSWQERALCAQTDPESFFPEKGGSTREAKKVCTGCEVRAECLEYALAHDERFGIWGGLSERERRRLKKAAV